MDQNPTRKRLAVSENVRGVLFDDAFAAAWFDIGNVHYRLGAWDEAIEAFSAALRTNPEPSWAARWREAARGGGAGDEVPSRPTEREGGLP